MIVTVIGARPQFVKAAVVSKAFQQAGIPEQVIHTGQHYDYKMSEVFFTELGLPGAEINLNVGSGSHATQTGEILTGIEKYLLDRLKEVSHVLLYGDTNSTLAGALAAAKLNIPSIGMINKIDFITRSCQFNCIMMLRHKHLPPILVGYDINYLTG